MVKFYDLIPRKLGCDVVGINLKTENRSEVIEQIKSDVFAHRLLFFANQGDISAERHVEISGWFGEVDTAIPNNKISPHPGVFRLSNDDSQGRPNVGADWHIDGVFNTKPFSHSLYHIVSVSRSGSTFFAPLTEIIENLKAKKRIKWDQLWTAHQWTPEIVQPLIYKHPVTKKLTLFINLTHTKRFIWNYNTPKEQISSDEESKEILQDIFEEIEVKNKDLIYEHKWESGDFIIADNLSVGHRSAYEAHYSKSDVGLRILHRTAVKGVHKIEK